MFFYLALVFVLFFLVAKLFGSRNILPNIFFLLMNFSWHTYNSLIPLTKQVFFKKQTCLHNYLIICLRYSLNFISYLGKMLGLHMLYFFSYYSLKHFKYTWLCDRAFLHIYSLNVVLVIRPTIFPYYVFLNKCVLTKVQQQHNKLSTRIYIYIYYFTSSS